MVGLIALIFLQLIGTLLVAIGITELLLDNEKREKEKYKSDPRIDQKFG